jgi:competence protein ComEA
MPVRIATLAEPYFRQLLEVAMLKKIAVALLGSMMFAGVAVAAVEVNSADQAALDSIPGVGPSTSRAIIAERDKNGKFRDWTDLQQRVKGIGERNVVKLSAAGLVVNGQPHAPSSTEVGKPATSPGNAVKTAAPSPEKGAPQPRQ